MAEPRIYFCTQIYFLTTKYFYLPTNLTNLHESLLCIFKGDLFGRTNLTNASEHSRKYLN